MVVYVDVLIALNLYINYFLIRGASLLLRKPVTGKRCLLSAAVGAVFSLTLLLPTMPIAVVALIKCAVACLMVLAAFGRVKPREFGSSVLCFLAISFLFAGVMSGLWLFAAPLGMMYDNGVVYFDIPITVIGLFTAAAYAIVRIIKYFSDRRLRCNEISTVAISAGEKICILKGLCDTGNGLYDIFSGKPVIVCRRERIEDIIPDGIKQYFSGANPAGEIRLLPCRTVNGESLIPVFIADRITVNGRQADAMVGVSGSELGEGIDCIFNPKIISL